MSDSIDPTQHIHMHARTVRHLPIVFLLLLLCLPTLRRGLGGPAVPMLPQELEPRAMQALHQLLLVVTVQDVLLCYVDVRSIDPVSLVCGRWPSRLPARPPTDASGSTHILCTDLELDQAQRPLGMVGADAAPGPSMGTSSCGRAAAA